MSKRFVKKHDNDHRKSIHHTINYKCVKSSTIKVQPDNTKS